MKNRMIIPCAGYGTRMGMPPSQSKEMLIDPATSSPIIDYALDIASVFGLNPLIIARAEKTDLIEYAEALECEVLIIKPKGEWPSTVLRSQPLWGSKNLLMLPDTRFSPAGEVINHMLRDIDNGASLSLGIHRVGDSTKWCMVDDYALVEKPKRQFSGYAMGLMAWQQYYGYEIFKTLARRGRRLDLVNTSFQYLDSFVDLTRTGKVESYDLPKA